MLIRDGAMLIRIDLQGCVDPHGVISDKGQTALVSGATHVVQKAASTR